MQKSKSPTTYKPRKRLKWFTDRVYKDIVKNNTINLFQLPIFISSKEMAKALHASQDKGHRYTHIKTTL